MLQKVENIEAAYKEVVRYMMRRGHKIISTTEINLSRYMLLRTDESFFLVMFKREFFRNFGIQFRNMGASGMGESVNITELKYAAANGAKDLIFIYPNGAIYTISISDFLMKSYEWKNKENKEVRSVSIHELKRENPESASVSPRKSTRIIERAPELQYTLDGVMASSGTINKASLGGKDE